MLKKVLVTGADGFIGSHLTELLLEKGFNVRALSYYNSFNYLGWLEELPSHKKLEIITGDIRDSHFCMQLMKEVDVVFHLAALIAIPYSYIAPESYIDTNVKGTLNICQAALDQGVKRIIHTSTSEVYGTALYTPIDEKHPLQPQSPYSASKIGADAIAMSFYNTFNMPLTIARPFNTYGPRQSARAVIPSIIVQIANGRTEISIGDLNPTRNFNYVKDTCNGLFKLSECSEAIGETVNIGSDFEISIGDTLNIISKLMNSDVKAIIDSKRIRPSNSEVFRLKCDNSKISTITGFEPEYSFEEGLKLTIDWFLNPYNLSKYKSDLYNV